MKAFVVAAASVFAALAAPNCRVAYRSTSASQGLFRSSTRTYRVFKNRGDCVSFVATKGKNQPANGP